MLLSLRWIKRTELGWRAWREENLPPGERWVLGKTKEERKIVSLFEEWPSTSIGTFDRVISVLIRKNWVEVVQNKEEKNSASNDSKENLLKGASAEIGGKEALQALIARYVYENNSENEMQKWIPKDHLDRLEKQGCGLIVIDKAPSSFFPSEKENPETVEDHIVFEISDDGWFLGEAIKKEETIIKNEIESGQLKQILLDPNKEKKLEDWIAFEEVYTPKKEKLEVDKKSFLDSNKVAFVSFSPTENSNEIDFLIDVFQNPSNIKSEERFEKKDVLLIKPTFEGFLEALNLSKEDVEKKNREITEKGELEKINSKLVSVSLNELLNSLNIESAVWDEKNEESAKELDESLVEAFKRGGVSILKIALKNSGWFDERRLEKNNKDWSETLGFDNNKKIAGGGVKELADLLGERALEYVNEIYVFGKESEKTIKEMKAKNTILNQGSANKKTFEFLQENANIRVQIELAEKKRESFLIKKKQEEDQFKKLSEERRKQEEEERIKRVRGSSVNDLFSRIQEKSKSKKD